MTLETEIQDLVENVGWKGLVTKGPPHRTEWVFEAKGETTRLTYILEYSLPVPLLGPLLDSLLMRPRWQRMLERSLQNLKTHFGGQGRSAPTDAKGAVRENPLQRTTDRLCFGPPLSEVTKRSIRPTGRSLPCAFQARTN